MARSRIGTLLIVVGSLLGIAAISLAAYNVWDSYRAGLEAEKVAKVVVQYQEESAPDPDPEVDDELEKELPVVEIDGNRYIGTISFPKLNLELPVLESWSLALLKIAPCRYMGTPYRGDLIICAHNYTTHFGRLGRLQIGDEVIFTDVEGNAFRYAVVERDTLAGTAVDELVSGEWDMTLFTCTLGGQTRLTVRCNLFEDDLVYG